MDMIATPTEVKTGTASRLSKARWIDQGKITTAAFDLRDRTPPETYVSFNHSESHEPDTIHEEAARNLKSKGISIKKNERIFFLDVEEALNEVNEDENLISFNERDMPHCALVYTTTKTEMIQEAKSTLCLISKIIPSTPPNIQESAKSKIPKLT